MPGYIVFNNTSGTSDQRSVLRWGDAPASLIAIQADGAEETAVAFAGTLPQNGTSSLIYTYNETTGALSTASFAEPNPPSLLHPDWVAAMARLNALLRACDWTQLPDAPLSTQELADWVAYRAALRAVPAQSGYFSNITWPDAPAEFEEFHS
jgi:hypothetical protein